MFGTIRSTYILSAFFLLYPGIVIGDSMGQDRHVTSTCAKDLDHILPYHPTGLDQMSTKKSAKTTFLKSQPCTRQLCSWIRPLWHPLFLQEFKVIFFLNFFWGPWLSFIFFFLSMCAIGVNYCFSLFCTFNVLFVALLGVLKTRDQGALHKIFSILRCLASSFPILFLHLS